MDRPQGTSSVHDLVQQAIEANKEHQHALKVYTKRLEAELETINKLIDAVDVAELDDEPDLDVGGSVVIPGCVRASAPIAAKELLSPGSPFRDDALRRSRYLSFVEVRTMKAKELEALAEAVRTENYRKYALDAQRLGRPTFPTITDSLELDKEGLDWDRIAEKMSSLSAATRTARECEIRWLGDQHPVFNHEPWSQDEITKVKSLIAECEDSPLDWVNITERLGTNRTPLDCMRNGTTRRTHHWTAESDDRLLQAIHVYGQDNWHLVARYVSEDVTPSQCSNRFQRTIDPSLKRVNWTPEEDARLRAAVVAYGSSWIEIAAVLPGRHNDQCRDRWTEQVNPVVNKNKWTDQEDRMLLDYTHKHEDASWKETAEHVGNGRTENMCRTRHATLQRGFKFVPATFVMDYQPPFGLASGPLPPPRRKGRKKLKQPDVVAPSTGASAANVPPSEAPKRKKERATRPRVESKVGQSILRFDSVPCRVTVPAASTPTNPQ
ncbi:hypothetical protein PAXRUDRAFT_368727 [Paxillus rubicundulus Ve08.2h10]|uniref:snRNA-activating protein complex subunit 4 n=1 Tax=Paxillus rubicundulus Ve08.2h10 TaxID=930991 RepID=A0A0D0DRI3_9AGAM|nr:hypothetical protein PAXRUDRAFT_368727 [Paxillus rubicundulus Ve08.2h10]